MSLELVKVAIIDNFCQFCSIQHFSKTLTEVTYIAKTDSQSFSPCLNLNAVLIEAGLMYF